MRVKRSTRKVKLAGKSIRSPEEFYGQIARKLRFPDYFGRNLDALWDVLTTDVKGPVELAWEDAEASKKFMGKDFENPWGIQTPKGAIRKMSSLLDSAVFPGMQGGPLEHVIAAKAVAFGEDLEERSSSDDTPGTSSSFSFSFNKCKLEMRNLKKGLFIILSDCNGQI